MARRVKLPPFAKVVIEVPEHRLIYRGRRISIIRTVKDQWGGRRLAIVEHEWDDPPFQINPRLKHIKHFIEVWKYSTALQSRSGVGFQFIKALKTNYITTLAEKLDTLWPMHFAAKELNNAPLHLKLLSPKHKTVEMRWLIGVINKLMPRGQQWLVKRDYIMRCGDRYVLTPKGHTYFVKAPHEIRD